MAPCYLEFMTTRTLNVPLKGFGAPASNASVQLAVLDPGDRVKRAAVVFLAFLLVAVGAIPIPLVHFVLVPGSFLAGVLLAAVRLTQREIVQSAEGACPFCGTRQRLGLAGRKYRLPRRVHCSSCGQELDLEALR